jgi:uncharacterized protein GlcG (DUF336 family)
MALVKKEPVFISQIRTKQMEDSLVLNSAEKLMVSAIGTLYRRKSRVIGAIGVSGAGCL